MKTKANFLLFLSFLLGLNLNAQQSSTRDYQYTFLKKEKLPLGKQLKHTWNTGALTEQEKKELDKEYKKLSEAMQEAKADDKLTAAEKANLKVLREDFKEDLVEKRSNSDLNPDKMIASLENRIKIGTADGSITPQEARELNAMVQYAKNIKVNRISRTTDLTKEKLAVALHKTNTSFYKERRDTDISCKNLSPADCKELNVLSQKYNNFKDI